jgi:hypothetical protein
MYSINAVPPSETERWEKRRRGADPICQCFVVLPVAFSESTAKRLNYHHLYSVNHANLIAKVLLLYISGASRVPEIPHLSRRSFHIDSVGQYARAKSLSIGQPEKDDIALVTRQRLIVAAFNNGHQ